MNPYDFSVETVREVGEFLLEAQQRGFETTSKEGSVRDVVTSIDIKANTKILEKLQATFPSHGVYSEEGNGRTSENDFLWAIDPIDGSSNFSRGIPHFAVTLGLLEKGVPIVGAIYNPNTKELFSFKKGEGAFCNGKKISVSEVRRLEKAQVAFSPGSRKPELWDWAGTSYRKLLEHSFKRGMYGSSALDICYVACGRVDVGIYGTLSVLDSAPALGLLYEAGGFATDALGNPLQFVEKAQKAYFGNSLDVVEEARNLLES